MQTALVVVLVMPAMFIGSWLIGTVHDKAKGSETVRRWYRGTVPSIAFFGTFWLADTEDVQRLRSLIFFLPRPCRFAWSSGGSGWTCGESSAQEKQHLRNQIEEAKRGDRSP